MEPVDGPVPGFRLLPKYRYLISKLPADGRTNFTDPIGRPTNYCLATYYLGIMHPEWGPAADICHEQKRFPGRYDASRGFQ